MSDNQAQPVSGNKQQRSRRWLLVLVLLLFLVVMWYQTRADGMLHVLLLETSGDAMLLKTPDGRVVLIDGGSDPSDLVLQLGHYLSPWQRTLDIMILTRSDMERLPAQVAVLEHYEVGLVVMAPISGHASMSSYHQALQDAWFALLQQQQTPVQVLWPGSQIPLDGALLTVLATGDGDTAGLVLRLDYGTFRMVLAQAAGPSLDEALLAQAEPITALVYPWSRPLDPLVPAWQPHMILFSHSYEMDDPVLMTWYERATFVHQGMAGLYHPELHGTIECITNGQHLTVITERHGQ
ncbi:MAG: hypothetical protein HC837_04290 [Chloroflexaceae bacterium]|nr:hypothetical protein [Chloroflexaceae bacterium]